MTFGLFKSARRRWIPSDPVDPVNTMLSLKVSGSVSFLSGVWERSWVYFCTREVIFVVQNCFKPLCSTDDIACGCSRSWMTLNSLWIVGFADIVWLESHDVSEGLRPALSIAVIFTVFKELRLRTYRSLSFLMSGMTNDVFIDTQTNSWVKSESFSAAKVGPLKRLWRLSFEYNASICMQISQLFVSV